MTNIDTEARVRDVVIAHPNLAREHVEDLVLGPVEMQRRRVALPRTVFEHRDAVRSVEMADADQHQRIQEPEAAVVGG